jgi:hypothetical protein
MCQQYEARHVPWCERRVARHAPFHRVEAQHHEPELSNSMLIRGKSPFPIFSFTRVGLLPSYVTA